MSNKGESAWTTTNNTQRHFHKGKILNDKKNTIKANKLLETIHVSLD